ncbi:hypothetical protein Zmor_008199 [Zophobas morio]|uniref:Uncharacterized protein n=1 Tax=Zophobas morio TaxID=2755281 RepID=A0AA38IV38_9CUCU|nr:hypothetical protein Zmor_008199 [Zophobas morio]
MAPSSPFCLACLLHFKYNVSEYFYPVQCFSWSCIVDSFQDYKLQNILDDQTSKKFKIFKICVPLVIVWSGFMTIILFLYGYDNFYGSLVRNLAVCICCIYHGMGFIMMLQRITLIVAILRALERNLCTVFTKKDENEVVLVLYLKQFQNLVLVLHKNISVWMESTILLLLVWFTVTTISLIFNIFILIKFEDYDIQNTIWLLFRNVAAIVVLLVVLGATEGLNKKVKLNPTNIFFTSLFSFSARGSAGVALKPETRISGGESPREQDNKIKRHEYFIQ